MIVCGVRNATKDKTKSFLRKRGSKIFNKLMQLISSIKFDVGVTDYMLLDKKILTLVLQYGDVNRIFRGIVWDLGYPIDVVYFDEPPRLAGRSGWPFAKLYNLALTSIVSFSAFPLKFVGFL